MSARPISIYMIAQTRINEEAFYSWLTDLGATEFIEKLKIQRGSGLSDAATLSGCSAKRCYLSYEPKMNPNVTRVREDWADFFDNVMNVGHGSVLEHCYFTFAFEGISRVLTAELNRHRAGVGISEASMRYIRMDYGLPYYLPGVLDFTAEEELLLKEITGEIPSSDDGDTPQKQTILKKMQTVKIFDHAFQQAFDNYNALLKLWSGEFADKSAFKVKKILTSLARRILPIGTSTGAVYTFNVRALRHILTMRCDEAAEEEICHLFSRVAMMMIEAEPLLFGDFHQDDNGFWRPAPNKKKV